MASVYKKHGKATTWYANYVDEVGRRRNQAIKGAKTKAEAQRHADDLERRAEKIREGLEVAPVKMTFGQLADYWLENYSKPRLRSHSCNVERLKLHLRPALEALLLHQVTPRVLEELLSSKLQTHSPQTVLHLRGLVRKLFNDAERWGYFHGKNPAKLVPPPKLTKKAPVYAAAEDVPKLLKAAAEPFRTMAAIAIYTGLREGEILALTRESIDLKLGLILATRTEGRETTKGGRFRAVPIVSELRPFLEAHLKSLAGDYLFPSYRSLKGVRQIIQRHLKYAKVRAGLVLGYDHVCRRRGCKTVERRDTASPGPCPKCGYMQWVTPIPMPLTFHQLRHSYISHLLMAGANPVAVQRLAGHADLKTTLDVYGHLAPGFMREEAERLRFGVKGEDFVPVPQTADTAKERLADCLDFDAAGAANDCEEQASEQTQDVEGDEDAGSTAPSGVLPGFYRLVPFAENKTGGPCGSARPVSPFLKCPRRDSNSCYRLERPASWASGRRGRTALLLLPV